MTDTITLTLPASPNMRGVATLVLGAVGSRLHLTYERVDDLQLAVLSALSASSEENVTIELTADEGSLVLEVGPLESGTGSDAGLRRVLDRLVDEVQTSERYGQDWLTMRLDRAGEPSA